ncbi:MAG: AzlC family ABC transporter permease [Lachnospiraceae bacterium]
MRRKALKAAFPLTLPVMAGYLFLGIGFGILLQEKGYGVFWAFLMSFAIYAGSMQYVAIELLSAGAGVLTTALMTLMVNARHLFYGLSMIDKYKDAGWKKPILIHELTDETYSVVCSKLPPKGVDKNWFYLWISVLNQLYWIAGSVIGAEAGARIPFDSEGIDFAMTALFLVILTDQWRENKNHLPAIAGLVLSVLSLLLFGAEHFVIPAMIGIIVFLSVFQKRIEGEGREDG